MADLFATLDDIAEDLRTELDRIDEAVVARSTDDGAAPEQPEASEQGADAMAFLSERWSGIDRPTDLAVLAWGLQKEFGAEVSDEWFGHRTFKRFVTHALPEAEITTGRQSFLLPPGSDPQEVTEPADEEPVAASDEDETTGPPEASLALRRVDRAFPLLDRDQWIVLYEELSEAWRRTGAVAQSPAVTNRIARSARDRAEAKGRAVSRRHTAYVARAVLPVDNEGPPLDADQIADAFATVTLQRLADLRILGARNRKGRAAVRRWLGA